MRLYKILSIFLVAVIFIVFDLKAQIIPSGNISKIKVSQLSDQQILEVWKKFQSSGMSEEDAIKVMVQKGIDPNEMYLFKQRLSLLQGSTKTNFPKTIIQKKDTVNFSRDTLKKDFPTVIIKKKPPIYGYDFFNNQNLKFEPNIRIATPKNYTLGPDDEVIILLTGLNETTVTAKISPDGNLKVPYAGLIYLNGYTIEQAQSIIKQKMQKVYPALASGSTQLTINLGNVKSVRVTIIGEVKQPGTYTISSLSSLFNALYLSGGPSDKGSLRNIEIIRNNKILRTVDFYSFLQKGLLTGNVRLEDQDVIRIPVYKKRVAIDGEIKRPGLYELLETETLDDLINYAGGFSDVAYKAMAKVVQMGDTERNVKDVPLNLFDQFVPKNADSVFFEPILERYSNRIVIEGAVYRPGVFELTQNLTLSQLIKKADGIRKDAFTSKGYIKRTLPDREKEMISFDLKNVLSSAQADISLMREDSVMILSNEDLKDELTVSIDGFVRSPGTFTFRKGMKVADIIALAGGFTNNAATHRVEISRLLRNEADTVANQLLNVLSIDVDSNLNTASNPVLLQPLDYIYVPRLVNYHSIGNVALNGEVLFPGDYALQRRDETALEVIKRAGGLTPNGSLNNAQVFRNGVRVNIDLTGRKNNQNPKALILMPGDSLIVPKEIPFVEVTGAVNNPQFVSFAGKGFKYYVNAAGGETQQALLKNAYVQYPNGINKPVKKFLFFKNYPPVIAGSKIVVPQRTNEIRLRLGFGEISAITSSLTALISIIAVLAR